MSHSQQTDDDGTSSPSTSIFDLSNTIPDPRTTNMESTTTLESINRRDQRALEYGKSSLDIGDTLVILHPEDYKPLDPTGFALNKELRVHSRRLIATDSKKFEKIFSVDVQRAARDFHYPDGLPKGIDFILDLRLVAALNLEIEEETFSDEIPKKLMEELTLPRGVRAWFRSQQRCGVPGHLVSGRDVVAGKTESRPDTPKETPNLKLSSIRNHFPSPKHLQPPQPPPAMFASQLEGETDYFFKADLLKALQLSAKDQGMNYADGPSNECNDVDASTMELEDVLEFCPVRYRIAIEHLLQIIEGREPTWLDSAPKIWTLYVVAKYFECAHYVTDRIFAWTMAPRNEIFIETLPETSLKMGFGLQNSIITRGAFGILVSEEALRISSFDACPDIPRGLLDLEETRFLRTREHLDDIHMKLIEQAGEQLYTRVKNTWEELSGPKMGWLRNLPEWEKIAKLENYASTLDDKIMIRKLDGIIETLETQLTDFVRGPIIRCLYEALSPSTVTIANHHRRSQQWNGAYLSNFKTMYDNFSPQERTMTRFFWQMVSKLEWDSATTGFNWAEFGNREWAVPDNPWSGRADYISDQHDIKRVWVSDVEREVHAFNLASLQAGISKPVMQLHDPDKKYGSMAGFNFWTFLAQVRIHVTKVCNEMLDKGELDWANSTDTLLCLTDAEWGILPDWEKKEVVIELPIRQKEEKEKCELTDLSDWEGADEESMSEWDLIEDLN